MSGVIRNLPFVGFGSWREPVPTPADLPLTGNAQGDVRIVQSTGELYQWNGTAWMLIATATGGLMSLNGLTATDQFFTTGTSGTDFNISSVGNTHTFNIPDAGLLKRGLVTTGTQIFSGNKTFNDNVSINGNVTIDTLNGFLTGTAGLVSSVSSINLNSDVSGVLPILNGGTGQTTANAALNAFLPSQAGNAGRVLGTNGTNSSWVLASVGTVTSVAVTSSNGTIGVTGSPITSSGIIDITLTPGSISTTTTGVTVGNGANSTVGPNVTINIQNASSTLNGLLTSTDWNTFNNKASNSFTTINAPSGTDPVATTATDTLNLTSSNGSITITGNSGTKTIDLISPFNGDVVGPASSTDNAVSRFDGTTGKLIQNSGVIISDTNNVTGIVDQTNTGNFINNGTVTLPAFTIAGVVHNNASGLLSSSLIVDGDVSGSASISYSKLNLTNSIVNSDVNTAAGIVYSKLNLTASILNADVAPAAGIAYSKLNLLASIVNADISPTAAIVYSKLSLTNSIVNADINASAAIAYSKLNLSNSIVNADINAAAGIAYSKLNLTNSIVNADVATGAAIARNKLALGSINRLVINDGTGVMIDAAAITANRALQSNASGIPVASTTTDTELGYVSGVTSSIQTQLDGKQAAGNYITDLTGDVTATGPGSAVATIANLAVTNAKIANATINLTTKVTGILPIANGGTNLSTTPTNGQLLIGNGTNYTLSTLTGTTNQVIVTNGSGSITLSTPQDINVGSSPTFLGLTLSSFATAGVVHNNASGVLSTSLIVNADVSASAAIAYSKLNLSNSIVNADVNTAAAIAYSKLNLANSIVNADINTAAAIAYSKLSLTNSIVDADINTAAAIARTKIASGTINHVIINDGTGVLSSEAQLALTRGGTNASNTANAGAIAYSNASGIVLNTPGTSTQLLQSNGTGAPTFVSQSTLTGIAHGNLTGLLNDDHTQYALLAGRSGGQVLNGGTAASNNLTLRSTSNATKGFVIIDDASLLGVGLTTPVAKIHQDSGTATATYHKFTANATTGQTATDGFDVGITATGVAELRQRENLDIQVLTNNTRTSTFASTGQFVVGSVGPQDITGGGLLPGSQILGTTATTAQLANIIYSNDAVGAIINIAKSRGAIGSQGILSNGDDIGRLQFRGSDGVNFLQGAHIRGILDAAPAVGSMPTKLSFSTTPASTSASVERMFIDSQGRVIVGTGGTAQDVTGASAFPLFQILGTTGVQMVGAQYSNDTIGPVFNLLKSRGTTVNAQGILSAADEFGRIQFRGSDGVNFQAGASIRGLVDAAPAAGSMPGRLILMTTPSASTTPVERLRIDSTGQAIFSNNIRLGDTTDTTDGNVRYNGEFLGRMSSTWRNLAIVPSTFTSGIAALTTTSATYTTITGLTTTPAAGTYLAFYSVNASISANSNGNVGIFIAAAEQTEATRNIGVTNSLGTSTVSGSLSAFTVITVNGSQVVDVRFRENGGGTLSVTNKIFSLIPIAR